MTHAAKARTGTLDDIATDTHVFSIIAMDQRNTLRRMFTAVGLDASDDDLRTAKADVARVLTPAATGLLSDPTYGVPAIAQANALAPNCGLLIAAEPSERRSFNGEPRTHRDPELNAQWLLDQGGDAYKFFIQLRADRPVPARGEPDLVGEALAVCEEIIRDCRAAGVPVVIENLVYERPGEDLRGQTREDAIIEAARALNDLDIDLLKLEYPGSPEACRRLADVLDRPWAVLSAGVPFDQFTDIIRISTQEGGASGFIAGRSVWREVVSLTGRERLDFLTSVALPRLDRLIDVARQSARPWTEASRSTVAASGNGELDPAGPRAF
jgi:tagatose-1,6-bisphosphate aldolase